MDELKELSWNFKYKGKNFENILTENASGDFKFYQNDNSIFLDQMGERYFVPMMIYGIQKMKSPEKAKKDLYKKDYLKNLEGEVSYSDERGKEYYDFLFFKMEKDGQFEIYEHDSREKIIKMGDNYKELNVFYEDEKIITLPYKQLSKAVDKAIEGSKKYFWRTNVDDMSKLINYYVSGGLEKEMEERERRKRERTKNYNKKP